MQGVKGTTDEDNVTQRQVLRRTARVKQIAGIKVQDRE